MKPTKTKRDMRRELDQEIEAYIASGGKVEQIEQGRSGNESNKNLFAFSGPESSIKTDRTPLTEIVKDLEQRKKSRTQSPPQKPSKPQKKLITDDFGEPIRWVWVD